MTDSVLVIEILLALSIRRFGADLLVVLLEGGEILPGLAELTLLHPLTHIPVHKGALGIHEIELVIDAAESLGNGSSIGDHAHGALNPGKVAPRDNRGRLIVDATLEAKERRGDTGG